MSFTRLSRHSDSADAPLVNTPRGAIDGFTLIELMVVLVILALFSSAIAPSVVSAVRKSGLSAEAQKLADTLDFACVSAITRHRAVIVNIDPARKRCWITAPKATLPWLEEDEESKTQVLAAMAFGERSDIAVVLGEEGAYDVSSSGPWTTLTFNSDGSTNDAVINLSDLDGQRCVVEVFGATGEVHLREGAP